MRKTEKNEMINTETIAYYSGFGGIEIKYNGIRISFDECLRA